MAQVDIAGGVLAARHARGRVATVAVNSFQFKQAVFIGEVLSFYGEIVVWATPRSRSTSRCTRAQSTDVETVKVTEAITHLSSPPARSQARVALPTGRDNGATGSDAKAQRLGAGRCFESLEFPRSRCGAPRR